jgi:site-specific recombinase XerD
MIHVAIARMVLAELSGGVTERLEQLGNRRIFLLQPERSAGAYPGLSLIGQENSKPLSRAALSELMRDAIVKAGLAGKCNSHGLRKAMLRRLAEAGATEKQIAAWSGHKTPREIER